MIEITRLRKSFGDVAAVRDVSFTAAEGQITGLLGENGAGKTTTLALACGLLVPDAGSIRVGPDGGEAADRRMLLGALLDHTGLYDRLTARENIEYFGRLHGMSGETLKSRVETLVRELGLQEIADRRTAGFSRGERLKVALGRAIVHAPTHLILDEPTNGLDVPSVQAFRSLMCRMRDRGACIIFSSHVLEEVRALCDRVVMISRGRIVADGDVAGICRQAGRATLDEAFMALSGHEEGVS